MDKTEKIKIAFFDLDETITDADTDMLWALWRVKRHPFSGIAEAFKLLGLNRDYYRGKLTGERYLNYHRFRVKKLTLPEYRSMAEQFFNEKGKFHILKGAEEIIRWYNDRDVPTVIITAQNEIIAGFFASHLGMKHIIGNSFDVEGHTFGEPRKPYCFQEGKIHWARDYASLLGTELSECAFYSDSINDVPLLEAAGFSCVVNPDGPLEKRARQEHWEVLKILS